MAMTVRKQLAFVALFETNNAAVLLGFARHFHRETPFGALAGLAAATAVVFLLRALTAMINIHNENLRDDLRRLLGVDANTHPCAKCVHDALEKDL